MSGRLGSAPELRLEVTRRRRTKEKREAREVARRAGIKEVLPPYHPHQPQKASGRTNRSTYGLKVQVGFATSLLVVVGLLRAPIFSNSGMFNIILDQQEVIKMEDIVQTRQDLPPPPPPRPPVPIAVADDEILEDDELNLDVTLDITEAVADLPPPPPDADEEEEELPFFVVVEDMPQMIGGLEALNKAVKYPPIAIKAGVEGRVTVQYIVDENGNVTEPVVLRGIGAGCDKEALRVIQLMKFVPGRQRGQPVKVKMASVVNFRLNAP